MGGNHYIMLQGKRQDTVTMGIASLRNHHACTHSLQSENTLNCFRQPYYCVHLIGVELMLMQTHWLNYPRQCH